MTEIIVYLAVNEHKRVLEFDYTTVAPDDGIWVRMKEDGAARVLSKAFNVPTYDWAGYDADTPIVVAQNLARMMWCDAGYLAEKERPTIAILFKESGKWGATCNACHRVVCKPMEVKHLPLVIETGRQHVRMTHSD